jgi:drug/metabolite transporter (DMT)-like permease
MTKVLIILGIALVLEAVGVVLISRGLKQIGEIQQVTAAGVVRIIREGIANPSILLGVALEMIFFGTLLYLLSQRDVSLIWPLTSLGFVLTALAAKFILREELHWTRWFGVVLIVIGAAFISYGENLKPKRPPASPATSGSVPGQK